VANTCAKFQSILDSDHNLFAPFWREHVRERLSCGSTITPYSIALLSRHRFRAQRRDLPAQPALAAGAISVLAPFFVALNIAGAVVQTFWAPSKSPVPTIIRQGLAFMPTGEAREQHRHDASEENTIKSPGAADRGDRRAELADRLEV
jgi:hypothetical protein